MSEPTPQAKNPLGLKRIFSALGYSLDGLHHALTREPAFQQELMALAVLSLVALLLPFGLATQVAILCVHLLVLIVELLNSAIEAVVDKTTPERHPLAKQAKDMGSAAVLLAFLMVALVWAYALGSWLG